MKLAEWSLFVSTSRMTWCSQPYYSEEIIVVKNKAVREIESQVFANYKRMITRVPHKIGTSLSSIDIY